ncbi:glycosyltransferase [Chitinophaga japonensis]|uniref:Glycosyltransferase involved in cell wall biosynthesis n=1 Tax=Chitinophaga japonensis TaxID=104662 RepID=A0A562SYD9_CHIJA|nr:glycosyltransferase [Chitinophaga japonensis]TWI86213.1 glycosyltransferase involved in cell wall biosynthesis [Chitinophaga japonensis]
MPLIENRDIVIVGLQQWYTPIGSNCKNIALQFAQHNRVLYVNSPLDRRTILQQRQDPEVQYHLQVVKRQAAGIVPIAENFWNLYPDRVLESINWIPFTPLFSLLNRVNNRRFARSIQAAINQLGFRNVIIFNDNDIFRGFYLKELLRPDKYVYYSRDYLVAMDYWKRHGAELEPKHIAKADVAVANSLYLTEMLQRYNPNGHYVGQGCDLSLFDPAQQQERPGDLPPAGAPVIGYIGALTAMRLDPEILLQISRARPEWRIVLVGPEDEVFQQSALHRQPNVHFLGRKSLPELPAYLQHFDVCINPQLLNEITIGNYPLKIDEYLAMGRPTVATDTKTMRLFSNHVYLAASPAEYVPLIEKALQEDTPALQDARIAFARSHTWENSVAAIYKAIAETR